MIFSLANYLKYAYCCSLVFVCTYFKKSDSKFELTKIIPMYFNKCC